MLITSLIQCQKKDNIMESLPKYNVQVCHPNPDYGIDLVSDKIKNFRRCTCYFTLRRLIWQMGRLWKRLDRTVWHSSHYAGLDTLGHKDGDHHFSGDLLFINRPVKYKEDENGKIFYEREIL